MARVVREVVERLLPSIPNLRSLNVGKCYKLTSADVGSILKSCPQLQALHFEVGAPPHPTQPLCVCHVVCHVSCVVCRAMRVLKLKPRGAESQTPPCARSSQPTPRCALSMYPS